MKKENQEIYEGISIKYEVFNCEPMDELEDFMSNQNYTVLTYENLEGENNHKRLYDLLFEILFHHINNPLGYVSCNLNVLNELKLYDQEFDGNHPNLNAMLLEKQEIISDIGEGIKEIQFLIGNLFKLYDKMCGLNNLNDILNVFTVLLEISSKKNISITSDVPKDFVEIKDIEMFIVEIFKHITYIMNDMLDEEKVLLQIIDKDSHGYIRIHISSESNIYNETVVEQYK